MTPTSNSLSKLLTRIAINQSTAHRLRPQSGSLATTAQCVRPLCMSRDRSLSTSPRGVKRRRLDTPPVCQVRAFVKMSPMLVQEIDESPLTSILPSKIVLEPVEETLRELLLDVAAYIDSQSTNTNIESNVTLPESLAKEPLCLRFTGGWVRDKLLGVPSVDIDVAINKMTGYQFGLKMKEYLEIEGNLAKYGLEAVAENDKQNAKAGATDKSKMVGGLHKIEANPEKSKHLETTTVRILGLDVDLVNLRKETYSEDSRNPQMEFGTAEEDALRRDATVNAMFYNINTLEIEDFTGRGYEDMQKRILRTPLEPYQTFKDDPLRVLRLIRFASRLGYKIEDEAQRAMRDATIKEALRQKISRERVGTELEKALRGPDPHEALRLIFDLELYETIFSDPSIAHADHYPPDLARWQILIDTLKDTLDSEGVLPSLLVRDKEERYMAWQLAAMVPYRDAPQPEGEAGKKPPPPVAVVVAREGIKAPNKISDLLTLSLRHQSEIVNFADRAYQKKRRPEKQFEGEDLTARDVLGMAIRRWGPSWRSQVMYSMLAEIASEDDVDAIERKYTAFVQHIQTLDLLEVCSLKPLLDGKALAKALATPPGPWMKDALDVVMAWQLRSPSHANLNPADAIAAVRASSSSPPGEQLSLDLARHFLELTIRPLFLKTTTTSSNNGSDARITPQGRKITTKDTPLPPKLSLQSPDETVTKPWKTAKDAHALDLLKWTISSALNSSTISTVWPLIIPPVLTLIDDWEVRYKTLGISLLSSLLIITPSSLLSRTGLHSVFESALMPCLTYLPTLTPVSDSTSLLNAAYPVLIHLSSLSSTPIKSYDTLIRKGIIYAHTHAGEYPAINIVLFTHLSTILDKLEVDGVKHLMYLVPILVQTLSHPHAAASTEMLLTAVKALQAVIRNSWPRIPGYQVEILKGLALCWLQIDGMEGEVVGRLREKMKETVRMLRFVVEQPALKEEKEGKDEGEKGFDEKCEVLVEADTRLRDLFARNAGGSGE